MEQEREPQPPPRAMQTERLVMRLPAPDDATAIFERWASDAEVTRYLPWRTHASLAASAAYVDFCLRGWERGDELTWLIVRKGETRPIGAIAYRPRQYKADIGYVLARSAWNRGYMTECVRHLIDRALAQPGMHRVWAVCDVENAASVRVLEKAGMEREGRLRRWLVRPSGGEQPYDCWCYARVRDAGRPAGRE